MTTYRSTTSNNGLALSAINEYIRLDVHCQPYGELTTVPVNLDRKQAVDLARRILGHYGEKTVEPDPKPGQVWDCFKGRRVVILDDQHCIEIGPSGQFRGPVLVTRTVGDDLYTLVSERYAGGHRLAS